MTVPGETEAGSAGKQPCRGIAWWAHRDDEAGACELCSAPLPQDYIGLIDPHALKIPAPQGRKTNFGRSPLLHFRLNHYSVGFRVGLPNIVLEPAGPLLLRERRGSARNR